MSRAISHRPSEHMIVRPFVLARRVLLLLGFLALGLAVVFVALRPRKEKAMVVEPSFAELDLDVDLAA